MNCFVIFVKYFVMNLNYYNIIFEESALVVSVKRQLSKGWPASIQHSESCRYELLTYRDNFYYVYIYSRSIALTIRSKSWLTDYTLRHRNT